MDESEPETITVADAQAMYSVSAISYVDELSADDRELDVYFDMLKRGRLTTFKRSIDLLSYEHRVKILNRRSEHEFQNTVLHVLLEWNNSNDADFLYRELRELYGARPVMNYHGNYPWCSAYYYIIGNKQYIRKTEEFKDLIDNVKTFERSVMQLD